MWRKLGGFFLALGLQGSSIYTPHPFARGGDSRAKRRLIGLVLQGGCGLSDVQFVVPADLPACYYVTFAPFYRSPLSPASKGILNRDVSPGGLLVYREQLRVDIFLGSLEGQAQHSRGSLCAEPG